MEVSAKKALWALEAIENGVTPLSQVQIQLNNLDPVLVHFVLLFLREKYGRGNPAGEGIVQRLLKLSTDFPEVVQLARKGETDPVTEWALDSHPVKDYYANPDELFDLLVDKIES